MIKSCVENLKPYMPTNRPVWKCSGLADDCGKYLMLDWNEATHDPSPLVVDAMKSLVKNPEFYKFYPNTNNEELIMSIADYIGLDGNKIVPFASSDTAHEYIVRTWLKPGDTVLISAPTYDNFRVTAESVSNNIVYCHRDFCRFDVNKFCYKIQSNSAKMVYICNPNNPTGDYIDMSSIEKIIQSFPGVLFVLDEAYIEFSGGSSALLVNLYDNIIITRTFSKAFGLANFRIGYIVSNEVNIIQLCKIRNQKNISTFAQVAAISALKDLDYMYEYVRDVKNARDWFVETLTELDFGIRCHRSYANFVLMEFASKDDKIALLQQLRNNFIFVRELSQADYLEKCLRITIGDRKQMERVVNTIKTMREPL